jgi:hypothetical protein
VQEPARRLQESRMRKAGTTMSVFFRIGIPYRKKG